MLHPFELEPEQLVEHIEEMVDATFADLTSEFMVLPKGNTFLEYEDFRNAYESLRRNTDGFNHFEIPKILECIKQNSRALLVIRTIMGLSPPEWAELASNELGSDITQGAARAIEKNCRENINYIRNLYMRRTVNKTPSRIEQLVCVAIQELNIGSRGSLPDSVHRLDKFDTQNGLESINYAATEHIPYPVLLYERYLGRPFASHRDAVSELVGEIIENAIEDTLRKHGVSYRKTGRAERIPGFGQAPDFCIPDEISPSVVIEAKITNDDGTARDKVARIKELETQRNSHLDEGRPYYQVVACIDGRGFKQRREDMRQLLYRLDGKVFTMSTLKYLINHTRIGEYATSH